jgi:two-component system, LytTR family, sensor kinase
MTTEVRYQKGMSLGWRFCLLVSLFATIPRLIFLWGPSFSTAVLLSGLRDICIQFTISFLLSWIFLYVSLTATFEVKNDFSEQPGWLKVTLLATIFFTLNECLFALKSVFDKNTDNMLLFRIVYYLYHALIVVGIGGFRHLLLSSQNNYRVRFENEQLKREQLKAQLEALRNQLNPHFLFNALNILNISIVTNPDLAQRIVLDLSDILRYNLKVQNQSLISLSDELDAARSYLDLYKARFGEKLIFYFSDIENSKQWFVIPLSLQILIENAIKHNVITSNQVLTIEVKLNSEEKQLVVINSVNKKSNVLSTGIGLKNLDRRYKIQTGKKTSAVEDQQQFIVKVPLIEAP